MPIIWGHIPLFEGRRRALVRFLARRFGALGPRGLGFTALLFQGFALQGEGVPADAHDSVSKPRICAGYEQLMRMILVQVCLG